MVSKFLTENLSAAAFVAGFVALYVGVAGLSRPWANIIAGALLMAIAARPYLMPRPRR